MVVVERIPTENCKEYDLANISLIGQRADTEYTSYWGFLFFKINQGGFTKIFLYLFQLNFNSNHILLYIEKPPTKVTQIKFRAIFFFFFITFCTQFF